MDEKLSLYIKEQRDRGISDDAIKRTLLGVGWSEADVSYAMNSSEVNTPASLVAEAPKSGINLKVVAAVIVGFLILVGGAYAYYEFQNESPEDIIVQAITNLAKAKSFDYNVQILVPLDMDSAESFLNSLSEPSEEFINEFRQRSEELGLVPGIDGASEQEILANYPLATVISDISGSLDKRDDSNIKSKLDIRLSLDFLRPSNLTEEILYLQTLFANKKFYITISLPSDNFQPETGFVPSGIAKQIADKWIVIDLESIKELSESFNPEIKDNIENFENNESSDKFDKYRDEIISSFKNSKVFSVTEENGTSDRYIYTLVLDKDGIKRFITEAYSILEKVEEDLKSNLNVPPKSALDDMINEIDNLPEESIPSFKIEIVKDGIFLAKIEPASANNRSLGSISFNNFNGDIQINSPADSLDIKELMQIILPMLFFGGSEFEFAPQL